MITDVARSPVDLEVVIPAFDEEERLGATLRATAEVLWSQPWSSRIVVVDNGSTDRTSEVADDVAGRVPVLVIGCSRRGKGAAVRRGVLTSPARWVGYCDADAATPAKLIAPAVDLLIAGHPIVIGSRYCAGGRVMVRQSLLRRLGGRGFRTLSRRLVGDLTDTQCGFKFFDGDLARRLFAESRTTGFAFDLELLALAHSAHLPVVELPVDWYDRRGSTLRSVRDGIRAYRELRGLRMIAEEPVDILTLDPGLLPPCPPEAPAASAGPATTGEVCGEPDPDCRSELA
ncbi:dolichyl-phosphate beta-glucosyltransferase [Actinoplanes sp. NPDC049599]|uniref:dolichyl-phosphate beta-glucosyltransferase n=1 Tax=Actinoplanes sp. NPDC049599 TaxID=3363903 RepID=UPI0037AAA089